jgi:hypothetical protein
MVVGDKKFGGILPQKSFCIFPPVGLKCEHFLKQIFGYTVQHNIVL